VTANLKARTVTLVGSEVSNLGSSSETRVRPGRSRLYQLVPTRPLGGEPRDTSGDTGPVRVPPNREPRKFWRFRGGRMANGGGLENH